MNKAICKVDGVVGRSGKNVGICGSSGVQQGGATACHHEGSCEHKQQTYGITTLTVRLTGKPAHKLDTETTSTLLQLLLGGKYPVDTSWVYTNVQNGDYNLTLKVPKVSVILDFTFESWDTLVEFMKHLPVGLEVSHDRAVEFYDYLRSLMKGKCEGCTSGFDGTEGNGYQPCGCEGAAEANPPTSE